MANSTKEFLTPSTGNFSKSRAFIITAHVARVILGLIFLVFGLNKFFLFITMPPPTEIAGEFIFGLSKAQYMFPLIGLIEVLGGVLLLSGRLVPFALLLLLPINLNIFLFHLVFAPEGMGMAIFLIIANILLAIYYWQVYKPIFKYDNAWKSKSS